VQTCQLHGKFGCHPCIVFGERQVGADTGETCGFSNSCEDERCDGRSLNACSRRGKKGIVNHAINERFVERISEWNRHAGEDSTQTPECPMGLCESSKFCNVLDTRGNGQTARVHGEGRKIVACHADDRNADRLEVLECAR